MLDDKELALASTQLAEFEANYHKTHQEVLAKYSSLIEDYKRLKSDYEEERDARERYKQLAKGQERNPFVLVLIDADGYVFDDDLVRNPNGNVEGGQRAAHLLNEAIKASLRARSLEHCTIMVRCYANFVGLSKALSRAGLVGADKRSLAPFAANFTRANELFDFVDAGELKENADFKIRAMFRQFVENAQCRHVFAAFCHDVGYISELLPHSHNRERITLVRNYAFHPEFSKLGLRVEDWPNVFRTSSLDSANTLYTPPSTASLLKQGIASPGKPTGFEKSRICQFFPKGACKYGNSCNNLHIRPGNTNMLSPSANAASDSTDWRKDAQSNKFPFPHTSRTSEADIYGPLTASDFLRLLPTEDQIPMDQVPINKDKHRLDAYIPDPSPEIKNAFFARVASQKLCNNHHIRGECANSECPYDHSPISPQLLACLKQVAFSMPCPRRGACRSVPCPYGHVCQKGDCRQRGGKTHCKIPYQMHAVDLKLDGYAAGVRANGKESIGDESGRTESNGSPSPARSESEAGSGGEGAMLND